MKNIILLSGLVGFTFLNAQEVNQTGLKALQSKFENQQEVYQSYRSILAQNKGISPNELNKNLIGKYSDFLVYIEPLDTEQILATNTDFLYNNTIADIAVTGEGMTIYQWDGGRVQTTHPEFQGRVENREDDEVEYSDHSTAIAGIMMAAGVNPQAQGMAPNAEVKAYDFYDNFEEMTEASSQNPDYMLSNHSYGYQAGWRWGEYDTDLGQGWYWFGYPDIDPNESVLHGIYSFLDENLDDISYNAPQHLIIKSAGNDRNLGPAGDSDYAYLDENDEWAPTYGYINSNCGTTGYDCIPYGSVAKNILLVGSINQISNSGRYIGPESVSPSTFTSFGPTDDGRIKPDVVSQGSSVYAPITNSDYYPEINGTSASAPSVTGIAALLQQIYYQLNDNYMNAAELKAVLLNTTNEVGDYDGPDYQYGYGLVDAFQAANLIVNDNSDQALIFTDLLSEDELNYNLITTGDGPVKATLVWIDPAKDAQSLPFELNDRTPVLINDLDMRIIENSSDTYYMPWTLDVENPSAAATPGDNTLDNVEQIVIENPTSTEYTLKINHKNVLENGEQYFAIALTGATLEPQGVSTISEPNTLKIYPNPVTESIHFVGLESANESKAMVYTMNGKLVLNKSVENNTLDVNELTSGNYLIIIKNGQQKFIKKFLKK